MGRPGIDGQAFKDRNPTSYPLTKIIVQEANQDCASPKPLAILCFGQMNDEELGADIDIFLRRFRKARRFRLRWTGRSIAFLPANRRVQAIRTSASDRTESLARH